MAYRRLMFCMCLALAGLGLLPGMLRATDVQAGTIYFSAQEGVALGGYDPVSFFAPDGPARGEIGHALMWKGVVWLFHSQDNLARFEANPRAYAPSYGGYCAYAMARGKVSKGDPGSWLVVDGRLYLFRTPRAEQLWLEHHEDMIAAATSHWPDIMRAQE